MSRLKIGLNKEGKRKIATTEIPAGEAFTPAVRVPNVVTKIKLVRAMREMELNGQPIWPQAKAALAAADVETQEDWDMASTIPRDSAAFNALADALGATTADRDALYTLAATK